LGEKIRTYKGDKRHRPETVKRTWSHRGGKEGVSGATAFGGESLRGGTRGIGWKAFVWFGEKGDIRGLLSRLKGGAKKLGTYAGGGVGGPIFLRESIRKGTQSLGGHCFGGKRGGRNGSGEREIKKFSELHNLPRTEKGGGEKKGETGRQLLLQAPRPFLRRGGGRRISH